MKEREFQTELIRGLKFRGFHAVPIPDSGAQRFDSRRCYDLGIGGSGIYYGVELKRGTTRLDFSVLQPHQREALQECRDAGHVPLVICIFVHDRELIGGRPRGRKSRKTYEAWAVPFGTFVYAEKIADRKSAPLEWWRNMGVELLPIKTPAFTRDGEPAYDAKGRRKWVWGWDFAEVHRTFGGFAVQSEVA